MEYSKALENFDRLHELASPDELQAIDEIIKAEPEFTIYTNLSRRLELGRSTLAETPNSSNDDFSRRGLNWVTALARVELGAMLAGFTNHPAPFFAVAGKGYDTLEYQEMVLDGAKLHFWALTNDPNFLGIVRSFDPSGVTLTYLRRLNVASAFVFAAGNSPNLQFSPAQQVEMNAYAKNLTDARTSLRAKIQAYLDTVIASTSLKGVTVDRQLVETCMNGVCRQFDQGANGE